MSAGGTVNLGAPVIKETETEGRLNTEARWFKVTTVVIAAAGAGLAIANAVFFDKIRKNGCGTTIAAKDADVMFWVNVILAIIFVILFIWALARLILAKDYREKKTEQLKTLVNPVVPGVSPISRRVVVQQPRSVEMSVLGPRTEHRATKKSTKATLVPMSASSAVSTKTKPRKTRTSKPQTKTRGHRTARVSSPRRVTSHKPQHGKSRRTVSGSRAV